MYQDVIYSAYCGTGPHRTLIRHSRGARRRMPPGGFRRHHRHLKYPVTIHNRGWMWELKRSTTRDGYGDFRPEGCLNIDRGIATTAARLVSDDRPTYPYKAIRLPCLREVRGQVPRACGASSENCDCQDDIPCESCGEPSAFVHLMTDGDCLCDECFEEESEREGYEEDDDA